MVSEGQRAVGEAAGIGAEPVASVRKCVLPMTSITLNRCEASRPIEPSIRSRLPGALGDGSAWLTALHPGR